ncbi:MAG: hypothetical protein U5N56_07730 [Candidatus Marinimicrobia bacterium]|nr:hypothetical protein [Candidatus Neomarinimicrobiota bacterium]
MSVLELIGYIASVVTAISLMMKNIRHLRWWNFAGASVFAIYGALINAWPVFVMNAFVAGVDIYYLAAMNRNEEYFDLLEVDVHTSDYVKRFLDYYKEDLFAFFPDFHIIPGKKYRACFGLRDARPVSFIVFSYLPDNEVLVEVDYAIPEYRDMRTGKYIYNEGVKRLGLDKGYRFICITDNPQHRRYLKAQGFKRSEGKDGVPVYVKVQEKA